MGYAMVASMAWSDVSARFALRARMGGASNTVLSVLGVSTTCSSQTVPSAVDARIIGYGDSVWSATLALMANGSKHANYVLLAHMGAFATRAENAMDVPMAALHASAESAMVVLMESFAA